jgi:hypothetical protein
MDLHLEVMGERCQDYLNLEKAYGELMVEYDKVKNDILLPYGIRQQSVSWRCCGCFCGIRSHDTNSVQCYPNHLKPDTL